MSPQFRPAQDSDLCAIVAIYNSTINGRQATADLQTVSVKSRQAWFNAHKQDPQRPLYVIEHHQQIIAWGSFSDYYPRAAYRISAEISIYVAQEARGQGWGQIMLEEMTQRAPQLGIRHIIGVIFAHNTASLKLFTRNGFNRWGYLPQVCDLQTHLADIVIMGKTLA